MNLTGHVKPEMPTGVTTHDDSAMLQLQIFFLQFYKFYNPTTLRTKFLFTTGRVLCFLRGGKGEEKGI